MTSDRGPKECRPEGGLRISLARRVYGKESRHTSDVGQGLAGEVLVNGLLDLLLAEKPAALEDMTQDHLGLALSLFRILVLSILAVVLVELLEQSSAEIVADRQGRHAGEEGNGGRREKGNKLRTLLLA